jgi:hypothetical protein
MTEKEQKIKNILLDMQRYSPPHCRGDVCSQLEDIVENTDDMVKEALQILEGK